MIQAAQSEAFKQENVLVKRLHCLDQQMERKGEESLYFMDRIWVLLVGSVMDEAHTSRYLVHTGADKTYYNLGDMYCLRYLSENEIESPWILSLNFQGQSNNSKEWNSGDDQLRLRWMIYLVVLADAAESVRDAIGFEYCLASSSGWTNIQCAPFEALYGRKCRSLVLWAEIRESSLTGLELVQETTDKVVLVKEKPKAARDCQKSYVDYRLKPLEFEVGDRVLLKVTPWKGVVRFGKKGKLAPRYVGPFEILERNDLDANLHVPLDEIKVDKTLRFVEESVEIMDREIKKLKHRKIALVKVRWNSKRGPKFTWEHEDQMRIKRVTWGIHGDVIVERNYFLVMRITCGYPWPELEGKRIWYDPRAIEVVCLVFEWLIGLTCMYYVWHGKVGGFTCMYCVRHVKGHRVLVMRDRMGTPT
ncbi:hypothetical protein Tco_0079678 [Tanacetum coccineum]